MRKLILILTWFFIQVSTFAGVADYWRFEEGSGTNVADQTGQANGTLNLFSGNSSDYWSANVPSSVVPQTGQSDNYSLLLGGNSRVVATRTSSLTLGSSFTMEMFFNFTALPNSQVLNPAGMLNLFDTNSGTGIGFGLSDTGSHVTYHFQLGAIADDGSQTLFYSDPVSPSGWNHVALVDNNGVGTFYLNGLAIGSTNIAGSFTLGANSTITIGQIGLIPAAYLDEVRISDTALAPSQFLDAIPEPSTFALLASALALLPIVRRRSGS